MTLQQKIEEKAIEVAVNCEGKTTRTYRINRIRVALNQVAQQAREETINEALKSGKCLPSVRELLGKKIEKWNT